MSQHQKQVVSLRRGVVITISIVILIVIALIFFNLWRTVHAMHANHTNDSSNSVRSLPSEADTNWYQHATIAKPTSVEHEKSEVHRLAPIKPISSTSSMPNQVVSDQPISQSEKEVIEAMKAPITSNQLISTQLGMNQSVQPSMEMLSSGKDSRLNGGIDQNMQNEKRQFVNESAQSSDIYLRNIVQSPMSQYELQAGTIIPGILLTGINSDLPGQIIGQVKSNVYDSITGKYLLVPQGAKLQGIYDSKVTYGQDGLLVVWKRIIFPDGTSISLDGMPGVDLNGYAGFRDLVDNHYSKVFSSVILMSMLGAGAQLSQPQQSNNANSAPSVGQIIAQSVGTNIANLGTMLTEKNLNVQPTIKVRQGYEFNISVTKDMVFMKPYA